ncbi:MAG TPA: ribosomal protein S18-alanine N-acetyltransferase [Terriglobales bacterium]|nr:ribosomal protein S18-alanine N-acetyltransferase [Terriglobales bacterium]
MTLEPEIRRARPEDLPQIRAIESQSPTAAHWAERDYLRLFESGSVPRVVVVIEAGDQVAGFIVVRCVEQDWEVENIVVERSAQRRGLGRKLLSRMLQLAFEGGASRVFLEVRESNQAARSLYLQCGFTESGRRRAYYLHPIEDAITYEIVTGL